MSINLGVEQSRVLNLILLTLFSSVINIIAFVISGFALLLPSLNILLYDFVSIILFVKFKYFNFFNFSNILVNNLTKV